LAMLFLSKLFGKNAEIFHVWRILQPYTLLRSVRGATR
jgi:hypothetical protein